MNEWLLLKATWVICQLYHGGNKLYWWDNDDDKVRFALDHHTELDCYSPNSLKQRVYMSLHPDILFWFWANPSLLLLIIDVCWEKSSKKYQLCSLWFGLTWPGLQSTIYRTWDSHASPLYHRYVWEIQRKYTYLPSDIHN